MLKEIINNKIKIALLISIIIYLFINLFFNNNNKYLKKKFKNYINVAYAFDKNYHYITHVSMKSIMLSQNKDTFIYL